MNLPGLNALSPAAAAVFVFAGLSTGVSACAGTSKSSSMDQARLEAAEAKLARMEERMASMEEKTSRLDGVAEGVELLLQRLDQIAGDSPERQDPDPAAVYSMPIEGDPYIGPKHAKVTIVKGYDFYCGYCDKVRPTLTQLREEYGNDVKIVFKNFVIHNEVARLPALAACAAHMQDKFMPMFESIWVKGIRDRNQLDEGQLVAIAKELKLNKKRFLADLHGPCEEKVEADFEAMAAVGARGTPAFYINGRFLSGAQPLRKFKRIINQELEKADKATASGVKLKDYYQSLVDSGKKSL